LINYLYGYDSEENSREVSDYPWGYRLRTEQRYWIESKEKFGQRFVTQTKNPKTGRWCKPKKSTYSEIIVMTEDEKGHVSFCGASHWSDPQHVEKFYETHKDNLSPFQVEQMKVLKSINEVRKHITMEIVPNPFGPVSLMSTKPEDIEKREKMKQWNEEHKKEQDEVNKNIGVLLANTYNNMKLN